MNIQEEHSTNPKPFVVPRKEDSHKVDEKILPLSIIRDKSQSKIRSMIKKFEDLKKPCLKSSGQPLACKTRWVAFVSGLKVKSLIQAFEYMSEENRSSPSKQPLAYLYRETPALRFDATKEGLISNGTLLKYVPTNLSVTSFNVTTFTSVTSSVDKRRLERCIQLTQNLQWMSEEYYYQGEYGPPIEIMAEKSSNPKIDKSILNDPNVCQKIKSTLLVVSRTVTWYSPLLDKVAKDDQMKRVRSHHKGLVKLVQLLMEETTSADDKRELADNVNDDLLRAETLATVYKLAKDLHAVLERIDRCLEH